MSEDIKYKCTSCDYVFTDSKRTDGIRCPICGPIAPIDKVDSSTPRLAKAEGLTITVNLKDTELFKSMYNIMDYLYMKADETTRQQAIKMMARVGIIQVDDEKEEGI